MYSKLGEQSDDVLMRHMAKRNVYDVIAICICFFSISTLLYNIINPIIPLNRIIGLIMLLAIVSTYKKTKPKVIIVSMLITMLFLLSLVNATSIKDSINNAIYWYSSMIILWFFSERKRLLALANSFEKNRKIVKFTVLLNLAIVAIGFLIQSCYLNIWGNRYYVGFAYGAHILACGCCLSMTLALFFIKEIKNDIFKILIFSPFILGILECGARTYLVSILVIIFLLFRCFIPNISIKIILIPLSITAGIYLFLKSGLMTKFLDPNTYSKWTGVDLFTNGRTIFWAIDLNAYGEGNLYRILLGNGFDFSYLTNLERYGRSNWAHNDFIETLISVGFIGLCFYLFVLYRNFRAYYDKHIWITCYAVVLYYLFVAFINGLIIYQHYLYSYIVLSAVLALYIDHEKKSIKKL